MNYCKQELKRFQFQIYYKEAKYSILNKIIVSVKIIFRIYFFDQTCMCSSYIAISLTFLQYFCFAFDNQSSY